MKDQKPVWITTDVHKQLKIKAAQACKPMNGYLKDLLEGHDDNK
jgi:hypothetical protein